MTMINHYFKVIQRNEAIPLYTSTKITYIDSMMLLLSQIDWSRPGIVQTTGHRACAPCVSNYPNDKEIMDNPTVRLSCQLNARGGVASLGSRLLTAKCCDIGRRCDREVRTAVIASLPSSASTSRYFAGRCQPRPAGLSRHVCRHRTARRGQKTVCDFVLG